MVDKWQRQDARALLAIGRLLAQLCEHDLAIKVLQRALKLNPEAIEARIELGITYGRAEAYQQMVVILREAIQYDQRGVRTAAAMYPADTDLLDGIIDAGEGATQSMPTLPELPVELRESLALVELALHDMRRWADRAAVAALERSLTLSNASFQTFILLVISYLLLEVEAGIPSGALDNSALKEVAPEVLVLLSKE